MADQSPTANMGGAEYLKLLQTEFPCVQSMWGTVYGDVRGDPMKAMPFHLPFVLSAGHVEHLRGDIPLPCPAPGSCPRER